MAGDAVEYTEANVGYLATPVGDAVEYTEANVGYLAAPVGNAVEYTNADIINTGTTGIQIRPSTQIMREGAGRGQVMTYDGSRWTALDPDSSWIAATAAKQDTDEKGQPNGYPTLDATGKIPTSEIPDDAAVLTAPDGTRYRIVVDNTGALSTTPA